MNTHIVFVYGTLKRGRGNNRLLATADFMGEAMTVAPYAMARWAPQVFEHDGSESGIPVRMLGHVRGEVYACDDATLARLDNLERHPDWYVRKQVQVQGADGGPMALAWLYFMPWDRGSDELTAPSRHTTHTWGK